MVGLLQWLSLDVIQLVKPTMVKLCYYDMVNNDEQFINYYSMEHCYVNCYKRSTSSNICQVVQ